MSFLMARLAGQRLALGAGLAATTAHQVAFLALPWCVQHGLDEGVTPGDTSRAAQWAGVTAAVAAIMLVAAATATWFSGLAANRIGHSLRTELVTAVVERDAAPDMGHGDLAMRATRDVGMVVMWARGLTRWVRVLVTIAVVVPAIALLDTSLLVVVLVAMPILALLSAQFPRRHERANEHLSDAHGRRADTVEDLLSASAAVRGIGGESTLVRRHHDASSHVTRHTMAVARIAAWWVSAPPAVLRLAIATGLGFGGAAAIDGRVTVGGLVAFVAWMIALTTAMTVLVDLLVNRGQARVAAARIAEVVGAEPAAEAGTGPALPARGVLRARGLTARRDGRPVLAPVDLTVAPGELVVVTGPTGSGKSLLTRLLCRLDVPAAGTITYGDADVLRAARADVWQRISLVPQRPVLLSGTVADNVRLDRDATDDDVRAAARVACLDEFVDDLPDGYDTAVGERGATLSGGQAQRLALARALLARPAVLVLDDVTSAVDARTERAVVERLRAWAGDTAVVFVSNRPAVVAAADRVVALRPPPSDELVAAAPAPAGGGRG